MVETAQVAKADPSGLAVMADGKDDQASTSCESPGLSLAEATDNLSLGSRAPDYEIPAAHVALLDSRPGLEEINEIMAAPVFTEPVRRYALGIDKEAFPQYGLFAGVVAASADSEARIRDPRVFYNVSAPSSAFICGSQGSGKSHSLSCLLENCLMASPAGPLPRPLTALLFHYDSFISDLNSEPCEAAYLSSSPDISVRVLCPRTNILAMRRMYARFKNVTVEPLRLSESDLDTDRIQELMALKMPNPPLYVHVMTRILRNLRTEQQNLGVESGFDYCRFKKRLDDAELTDMQLCPLAQRLDTLESFMVEEQASSHPLRARGRGGFGHGSMHEPVPARKRSKGTDWTPKAGQLTIVDLSCPCITAETACSLFNICLSLFLEQSCDTVGRAIALDEAHKYMGDSAECQILTQSLLSAIRLQRHLGARIFISTQEPTVSPKLLDLCSMTLVHRFTSPDWLEALKKHLAGLSAAARLLHRLEGRDGAEGADGGAAAATAAAVGAGGITPITFSSDEPSMELFSRIVQLRVGEALLFAPSAIIGVGVVDAGSGGGNDHGDVGDAGIRQLGYGVLKVRVRNRITSDGGKSIMA